MYTYTKLKIFDALKLIYYQTDFKNKIFLSKLSNVIDFIYVLLKIVLIYYFTH